MTIPFEQAAAWGQGGFEPRGDRDEARVRRDFWRKAARVAARLPFAEDLLAALRMVAGHVRAEHRDAARAALARIKARSE